MNNARSFGEWLRKRRKALDLTQEQLADKVGVAPDYIRKLEKDARRASAAVAERIAVCLGVPADQVPEVVHLARLGSEAEADELQVIPPQEQLVPRPLPPYNLPVWRTPFIGRRELVEEVSTILLRKEVRLLTLTGPPGIGKTRLSSEVAMQVLGHFPDGVYLVRLSPVSDPEQMLPAIARELGVKEVSNRPPLDELKDYLREKRMLLVLDNFEQIIAAGPQVAELVQACPELEVLVSSRAPLHVYGEYEFAMPPMNMPDPEGPTSPEAIGAFEAVDAARRSQSVDHLFALTGENASTVAEICRQLDGLPLAIELAAARIKVLSPRQLLDHLTNRLKLLTKGAEDLPDRQRTLRGAIDWSYDLLEDAEKTLFARMSVFVGGGTLEAVETVCALPGERDFEALDGIGSLLDKSLLRRDDRGEDPSFGMLWTIREYAQERLEESGKAQTIKRQHAAYFLALAEQSEPKLTGGQRGPWLERLEEERHNLRAALEWCLSDAGDEEMGLRLAGALGWFWFFHSYLSEGRRWLEAALAQPGSLRWTAGRAKALNAAARLAVPLSDWKQAQSFLEESSVLWKTLDDKRGLAYALSELGYVQAIENNAPGAPVLIEEAVALFRATGDKWGLAYALDQLASAHTWEVGYDRQLAPFWEESLSIYRQLGDSWGIAEQLANLARVALRQGDYASASARHAEALALYREVGDKWSTAGTAIDLGFISQASGDYQTAAALYDEALTLFLQLGDRLRTATALRGLGNVAFYSKEYHKAANLYKKSLTLAWELRAEQSIAFCLERLGSIAVVRGRPEEAARLLGKAAAIHEAIGTNMPDVYRTQYDSDLSTLREALDEAVFTTNWAEGQRMTLEQAVYNALAIEAGPQP